MNTKETQQAMASNETMFVDGFDDAIIGLDTTGEVFRVIYDRDRMIDMLRYRDGMDTEEAIEYLEYNMWGAYVGEGTPIYAHEGGKERVLELMSQL